MDQEVETVGHKKYSREDEDPKQWKLRDLLQEPNFGVQVSQTKAKGERHESGSRAIVFCDMLTMVVRVRVRKGLRRSGGIRPAEVSSSSTRLVHSTCGYVLYSTSVLHCWKHRKVCSLLPRERQSIDRQRLLF